MTFSTATTTTSPYRTPLAGFAAQLLLLGVLAVSVGLSTWGWLAGVAYGAVLCGLLSFALQRAAMNRLGWANAVTFGRAILTGGVTAMVFTPGAPALLLVAIAAVALAMDGVDGQVARRTGTTTTLGARFDMEVDAFLILVLSIFAATQYGWWALAIGAFRYVFVAASWALPWLNAALPPRFGRKVVAAQQGVMLAVVGSGLLPGWLAVVALAVALGSLTWSFGRDIVWLHQASRIRSAARSRWSAPHREHALVG
ncbi:CDP-alcohol phosphatidyltransferase family protein [Actinoplanes xinjiangensis]|uniref:Phosphatidylglycerophosphate synthase n=1 Tax=Actinoplanes xinjiangensis TaxID=512350 RepID=A0A316F7D7_9ACTN|nr:CDP-alcohol phosphatidyltransferase family protein [Actinoplanes xinjiangensis]PWK42615.1 phosphatidylglycerophosphate synthase [Actinoplanes xinjiangensis]GIF38175.1 membrane protein [Actinoplanes xinjiangensis]